MDAESGDDDKDGLTSKWGGELRQDWLRWPNESGSWFQRRGDAYLNEQSVIFSEEMVGGRERVRTDEQRVLRSDWTEIARLTGCKNFIGKRKKFIFNAFVDLKPMERFDNGSDICWFKCIDNSASKRVFDLLKPVKLIVWKVMIELQ